MYVKTEQVTDLIRNRTAAQEAIANLLLQFASDTASTRLVDEAKFAKQSVEETAMRVAGNVLNSLVTRKPDGEVRFP